MLKLLKKHNDSFFVSLLLVLLAGSSWYFTESMSQKISFLEKEVQKIDKQDIYFLKQTNELLAKRKNIQEEIVNYSTLQTTIEQNKPEELKKDLSKNSKSSELLTILPPSEIANIQQKETAKKITDDIVSFKEQSAILWQSLNKLSSEDFSENQFVIGNISDSALKSSLATDIANLLKKEKEIFSSIAGYDNDFDKFSVTTEKLDQVLPLLKNQQSKNKQLIKSKIDSLNQELYVIEIVSVVGLISLAIVLIFVLYKKTKKTKPKTLHPTTELVDYEEGLSVINTLKTENSVELNLYEKYLNIVEELNTSLNKKINLHFDMEQFDSLTTTQKDKLSEIIKHMIKFSLIYSFNENQSGDIIVSLKENNELKQLVFKDNGKGLFVEQLKSKIKNQYGVDDNVFIGKTNQQIFSFIFKKGFELLPYFEGSQNNLELNVVADIVKELHGSISLNSQENHGIEFSVKFKSF